MNDIFETCVFSKIKKGFRKRKHTALSFDSVEFNQEVDNNLLNFDDLRKRDKSAKIVQMQKGYMVKLGKSHLAFDMGSILSDKNPGVDLRFSEDLLEYEPDEELIVKSKVPLWVIKPIEGGSTVSIQRVW
jgi:hypothetical protein